MKLVLSVLLGAAVAPAAAINLNLKGLWQQTELAVADAMRPLSTSDRNAVGTALTNALGVLNGNQKPASKLVTCLKLFPNRKQESESNALWESCKEVVTPGTQLNALALKQSSSKELPPIDEEGYKADWQTEHRSEPYPKESKGLQHHPKYNTSPPGFMWQAWMTQYLLGFLFLIIVVAGMYYFMKK